MVIGNPTERTRGSAGNAIGVNRRIVQISLCSDHGRYVSTKVCGREKMREETRRRRCQEQGHMTNQHRHNALATITFIPTVSPRDTRKHVKAGAVRAQSGIPAPTPNPSTSPERRQIVVDATDMSPAIYEQVQACRRRRFRRGPAVPQA